MIILYVKSNEMFVLKCNMSSLLLQDANVKSIVWEVIHKNIDAVYEATVTHLL